jgi:hypothetical protein
MKLHRGSNFSGAKVTTCEIQRKILCKNKVTMKEESTPIREATIVSNNRFCESGSKKTELRNSSCDLN